ncbi:ParB family protein [Nitrosospira sp. Nsp11]|uniref:ParB/RepB/Spo0J family partition protein n=1 Tax=Nitrosospira sp. Nsp11 TaxID=1855338 RepID=UPI000917C6B8|nr:ParB/RepB/Spo0J family partition protein [Nitrosospira sp. Nsp11]SHM14064.1 ParB family protein [Nitrosospira sp. Nsp11]
MAVQRPIELPISLIDEDPFQPRTEFDQDLLNEMAKTIRSRGVKNPISVHKHPTEPGRYVINDGARRYRASILAGKKTIRAFVDSDFTKIDQIIVNAHHQTFSAREWAAIIQKEQQRGKKNHEIADQLGKSRVFVTHHTKLLALPGSLEDVFNSGRCTNATALYELSGLWANDSKAVEEWLADETRDITRGTVKELRIFLDAKSHRSNRKPPEFTVEDELTFSDNNNFRSDPAVNEGERPGLKEPESTVKRKLKVLVKHGGRAARPIFNRSLTEAGLAWFKYEDNGVEFESRLDEIQEVTLVAD